LEEVLAAIWGRLIEMKDVGVFDHFFEVGGHSLLAARLLDQSSTRRACRRRCPCSFADDTIAGLARTLRERRPEPIVTRHVPDLRARHPRGVRRTLAQPHAASASTADNSRPL
jgi:hypothetical protein